MVEQNALRGWIEGGVSEGVDRLPVEPDTEAEAQIRQRLVAVLGVQRRERARGPVLDGSFDRLQHLNLAAPDSGVDQDRRGDGPRLGQPVEGFALEGEAELQIVGAPIVRHVDAEILAEGEASPPVGVVVVFLLLWPNRVVGSAQLVHRQRQRSGSLAFLFKAGEPLGSG